MNILVIAVMARMKRMRVFRFSAGTKNARAGQEKIPTIARRTASLLFAGMDFATNTMAKIYIIVFRTARLNAAIICVMEVKITLAVLKTAISQFRQNAGMEYAISV